MLFSLVLFVCFSFCFGDIFKRTTPDVLFQNGCDVFYLNFLLNCLYSSVFVCETTVVTNAPANCAVHLLPILICKL